MPSFCRFHLVFEFRSGMDFTIFTALNTFKLPWQVCRCISELCRHRGSSISSMLSECKARADIPSPEVDLCYVYDVVFSLLFPVIWTWNWTVFLMYLYSGVVGPLAGAFAWSTGEGAAGYSYFDSMFSSSLISLDYYFKIL